ncbi:MAG: hypothetical protein ACOYLM_07075 [Methylococcaceae bacterium]|jgi:hypothetical protein
MKAMRNPDAKHTDFTDLIGVIPSNLKLLPSNLDMVIERFGNFLVGEWKRPSEKISLGQEILLKRLATKEDFTVLLIEGDTDDGMVVHKIEAFAKDGGLVHIGDDVNALKGFIRFWYEHAEKKARGIA